MNVDEVMQFEAFWGYVQRAEQDIRINGHRGSPPPDALCDEWDEGFEAAYLAIKPFLRKRRRERVFFLPPDLPGGSIPHKAETAHQALMHFLNPTQNVYGCPGVLETPEYKVIKAEAVEELRLRKEDREKVAQEPKSYRPDSMAKARLLSSFLIDYHKGQQQDGLVMKPLTEEEISERISKKLGAGWSQASVSRAMDLLYPHGGINDYKDACISGAIIIRGFMNQREDGSSEVDASSSKIPRTKRTRAHKAEY